MELNRPTIKKILLIIAASVLMVCCALRFSVVLGLLKKVISVLSPCIIGLCLAFVLNLLLRPLERWWMRIWKNPKHARWAKGGKRPVCLVLSLLIFFGIIFAVFFVIVPQIGETATDVANRMPSYLEKLDLWWGDVRLELEQYSIMLPQFDLADNGMLDKAMELLTKGGETIFNTTVGITSAIISSVANTVMGIVFSIYFLADKEKLGRQARRLLYAIGRKERIDAWIAFVGRVDSTFTNFVTGQLLEAGIIGVLCLIGMLIFRMPYAAAISVLVGATALIPIFGAFIGTAIGALLILVVSPVKAFWFVVFILVLQQLEGNLIYPHVVGKSVGLPSIWVFSAVTVGGSAFGVPGMLLAVPVCSIAYVTVRQLIDRRLEQKQDAAPAPQPSDEPN